jgi:putative zinc finger protein
VDERSSDFRDALLELIEMSPEPVDHPSPDQWIAYHRGELPAEEEARLQEHLARCRDCFDLAEGAAAFAQPDAEPNAGQEVETAALWHLLRPQLGSSGDNVRAISAGARRPPWGSRLPSLLAASFFVALVGLTAWSLHQRSALEALRAPRPNAPIFDVAAVERDATRRELTMPTGPRMLVLHPAEDLPVYRLAIRDAATGRDLGSYELRLDKDLAALTLYLPEGLPPGRYRMELSGGQPSRLLETRLLRVTEAGRGE